MAVHIDGLGQSLGDSLVTGGTIYQDIRETWYVNSVTGNDSSDGRNTLLPLATLAQAQTNATNGDVVVLQDGHVETYTSSLTISKELIIAAGGSSAGKPTVKFTNNQAGGSLFLLTGDFVELRNIWFPEEAQGNSVAKIVISGNGCKVKDCYFAVSDTSDDPALELNLSAGDVCDIVSTTFISTSASTDTGPEQPLNSIGTGFLRMNGVIFDGGSAGFKGGGYGYTDDATGLTRVIAENMSLLNGAGILLDTASTGLVQVSSKSGGPRVDWLNV